MDESLWALSITAAFVGSVHTLLGPDHYLPFVMMGRVWGWSREKLIWVTLACGLAHVLSSVAIGAVGIAVGIAVSRLEGLEGLRGSVAAWGLIGFGFAYMVWGLRQAYRNRTHEHLHLHADGSVHTHPHSHAADHLHLHEAGSGAGTVSRATPWVLFTIFVFGPCEPLIPLLMVPAAKHSTAGVVWVTAVFGFTTLATTLCIVLLCHAGISAVRLGRMERYSHALAGAALLACGLAVEFLGI
jgi:hypothetical protein